MYDDVPEIYHDIKDLTFHSTSENGLLGIIKDQKIRPYDGTFEARWNVSKDSTTYGLKNKYVCLFDFESCSVDQSLKYPSQWHNVVLAHEPFCYLIIIDREKIKADIVENKVAVDETNYSIKFIPYVEAWSKKAIPLSAFKHLLVLQNFMRDSSHFVKKISFDKQLMANIDTYRKELISTYSDEYTSWKHTKRNLDRFNEVSRKNISKS